MTAPEALLATLRRQGAPASHLARMAALLALAQREPGLLRALFLVGSYAKGSGDRVSDLDLVAIAAPGGSASLLAAASEILREHEVLNEFAGHHAAGCFRKFVYLDFASVEFHAFEPDTAFRLKRPFLTAWDPGDLLPAYLAEGEPIKHEDFAAYEHGDAGLIWELVDCIKWLSRGRSALARHHLMKLGAAIEAHERAERGA